MHVRKRNGTLEPVNLNKIVVSLERCCDGLPNVDAYRIATKTVGGLVDGVSTRELDLLSVRTAKDLIIEDPIYSRVASRILSNTIHKEVGGQDIQSFSQSIELGYKEGLISEATHELVMQNKRKLNAAVKHDRDWLFEYHGLQTVYDRYLLKHPTQEIDGTKQRMVIETPQYFFMRVACGLAENAGEAIEFYNLLSSLEYMTSTPTLFNSGTVHSQMSSCFVAGTEVMTVNAGPKKIEDIAIGDTVVTHCGNVRPVTQLHRNPLDGRRLFDLRCFGTPSFTVTDNHRMWSISDEQLRWGITTPSWNCVDYLRTGDWIAIPTWSGEIEHETIDFGELCSLFPTDGCNVRYDYTVQTNTVEITSHWTRADHLNGNPAGIAMSKSHVTLNRFLRIDNDFANFLGVWYGDGHILSRRNSSGKQLASGIGVTIHRSNERLIAFCMEVGKIYFGLDGIIDPVEDQNVVQVQFFSTLLGNTFAHLFGRGFAGKRLHEGCFRWKKSLFQHFLTGLVSSDGCVASTGTVTVQMANPSLIKSIYMVARNLGITCTYRDLKQIGKYSVQARMSIPLSALVVGDIRKIYEDERLLDLTEKPLSNFVKVIDNVTYVRINKKSVSCVLPDVVFTLGVEDEHSYSVEGILCENCYLNDSPLDSLDDIYKRYQDIALLSKFAGGIGVSMSRLRGHGSLIKGTNGRSNGLVPWAHTLSGSVAAVNQGGKRKGAACIYLETHHPDIMQFLELKDNTGEREQRAYNLNLANWVSDLFMKRVKNDEMWSLFDATVAPELNDLYGDAYEKRYLELEAESNYTERLPARKVYARIMRTLAETGNGWMTFKDTANRRGNQVNDDAGTMIHLSNLCVEILEVTSSGKRGYLTRQEMQALSATDMIEKNVRVVGFDTRKNMFEVITGAEVAVCNLGSINIGRGYIKHGKLDKEKLRRNVAIAVRYLDRVIDRNYYPIGEAEASNLRWRPVGLGLMGLADFFFQMQVPFESKEAIQLSAEIQEEIYYQALKTSCELAKQHGAHRDFHLTRAAKSQLQFDLAGVEPSDPERWAALKVEIAQHGLRNSLVIAVAPTATISHICGVEEAIEPIKSNLLKRETLSGEFIAINKYLVEDLRKLGCWTPEIINRIKTDEGSICNIPDLPQEMYALYKTVWEMSMKPLIAHAVARGAFIDQSQSLNLFIDLNKYPEDRRIGILSSLYMHAWESGLKTTYYFRSRAASRIEQTTVRDTNLAPIHILTVPTMAPETQEVCESCQ